MMNSVGTTNLLKISFVYRRNNNKLIPKAQENNVLDEESKEVPSNQGK